MIAPEPLYKSPDSSYGFRKCCEAVRGAVPVEEIARRYTNLEPLGGKAWFTGRCPLPDHPDNDPSFYIYPPGRWWCYGCDRGGDVVDLEFHCGDHTELWEAMISLAVEYDVKLPERPRSWFGRQARQKPTRDALEEAMIRHVQRRLFRVFLLPEIQKIESDRERAEEYRAAWEDLRPVAEGVVAGRR